MNCFLSWNLKDMTGISSEKLQKNISQQKSYMELYKAELLKEALRFNVASLLRHVCMNRSSFGSDEFQTKATDCLIVFLHALSFQKEAYFTPTDVENPAVPKGCRNLHRLMLENLKATMKYIDYGVLLEHANGQTDVNGMYSLRRAIYAEAFPNDDMLDVCPQESINEDFFRIIDQETTKAACFMDFDVRRFTSFNAAFCDMFAKVPRQDEAMPESGYGIIGSSLPYLATPFIRYGNSYYSFVSNYSLKNISTILSLFISQKEEQPQEEQKPQEEQPQESPVDQPVEEQIPVALPVTEESPVEAETIEAEPAPEEETEVIPSEEATEEVLDEAPEVVTEEPVEETVISEEEVISEETIADEAADMTENPQANTVQAIEEPRQEEPVTEEVPEFATSEEEMAPETEEAYEEKSEDYPDDDEDSDEFEVPEENPAEEAFFHDDEDEYSEEETGSEEPTTEAETAEPEEVVFDEDETETEDGQPEQQESLEEQPEQPVQPVQPANETQTIEDLYGEDDFEEFYVEEQPSEDDESAYYETDEYEYPDEFEEDYSNSLTAEEMETHEVLDLAEEQEEDEEPVEDESQEDESDESLAEQKLVENQESDDYTALVSPDTYGYLDETDPDEFETDPMLEEQETLEDLQDEDDYDTTEEQPSEDDDDPYASESLFSLCEDEEEAPEEESVQEEPAVEESEPEETEDVQIVSEEPESAPEPIAEEPEHQAITEPVEEPAAEEPIPEEEAPVESEVAVEPETPAPEPVPAAEPQPVAEPEPTPEPEQVVEPEPEPEPEAVQQTESGMLPLLEHILKFSPSRNNPITQYIQHCDIPQQKELVRVIELARKSWIIDSKDKMFSIPGTEISIAIFSETKDPMTRIQRMENIGAVMFAQQKDSWNSLELYFDVSGQMTNALYNRIGRNNFSDWEWKIVEKLGTRLMERMSK